MERKRSGSSKTINEEKKLADVEGAEGYGELWRRMMLKTKRMMRSLGENGF